MNVLRKRHLDAPQMWPFGRMRHIYHIYRPWLSSFDWASLCELSYDGCVGPVVVLPAAGSSGDLDSDSKMGLGIAVGILSLAVVVVLAAAAVLYRRHKRFWSERPAKQTIGWLGRVDLSVWICDYRSKLCVLLCPFLHLDFCDLVFFFLDELYRAEQSEMQNELRHWEMIFR